MIPYKPIGIISTPFRERVGTPRQSVGAADVEASITIFPEFREGLRDLAGFSHIMVLFHMHLITDAPLIAHPPWDSVPHGVFATCSPHRPNPIGVSIVELREIYEGTLRIAGVDMVDQTPVLDIKPFVASLVPTGNIRIGWLTGKEDLQNSSNAGATRTPG